MSNLLFIKAFRPVTDIESYLIVAAGGGHCALLTRSGRNLNLGGAAFYSDQCFFPANSDEIIKTTEDWLGRFIQ